MGDLHPYSLSPRASHLKDEPPAGGPTPPPVEPPAAMPAISAPLVLDLLLRGGDADPLLLVGAILTRDHAHVPAGRLGVDRHSRPILLSRLRMLIADRDT
jgi:hypothetical protein